MASAVLARTTSNGGGAFMAKLPFTNPNPNPNPKKRQQQQQYHHHHHHHHHDESPAVTQSIASDDASSINHRRRHNNNNNHHHNHNNNNNNSSTTTELQGSQNHSKQYLSINIATYSKKQLRDLKVRLVSELEQIRQLRLRIEHHSNNGGGGGGGATTAPISSKKSKGKKRSLALENPISNPNANSSTAVAGLGSMMKACKDVLTKLRKHKSGWVFNEPVDVAGMGLHDYYDIIKQPMDLGTVKSRLARDFYRSPLDFAADVRLTFTNALTYNPKGHLVHGMAEQLLARFEELFRPIGEKIDPIEIDQQQHHHRPQIEHQQQQQQQQQQQRQVFDVEEELQASSWNNKKNSVDVDDDDAADDDHLVRIEEKSERIDKVLVDRSERLQAPASSSNPPTTTKAAAQPVKPLKQPKPKAKDPNKREMSIEEKHKLGLGLQSLPPEKMEQVVQIIRKRNGHLKQDGDEIELDIEAVDTETLWELDRLVTNWKKMVSKIKRQALMGNNMKNNVELPVSEKIEVVASEAKKPKKGGGEVGEEDVDIGDDMPMCNFPPVEIEKDVGGHASSSSSSSSSSDSDSSSSSDSDSGSSSGSDSDADNAQS